MQVKPTISSLLASPASATRRSAFRKINYTRTRFPKTFPKASAVSPFHAARPQRHTTRSTRWIFFCEKSAIRRKIEHEFPCLPLRYDDEMAPAAKGRSCRKDFRYFHPSFPPSTAVGVLAFTSLRCIAAAACHQVCGRPSTDGNSYTVHLSELNQPKTKPDDRIRGTLRAINYFPFHGIEGCSQITPGLFFLVSQHKATRPLSISKPIRFEQPSIH